MEYSDSSDITKLLRWLEIREEWGAGYPIDRIQLWNDISHSALLRRLLNGDRIFDTPPPLSYSYPWYHLVENGESESSDVTVYEEGLFGLGPCLVINQSRWTIKQKISNDEYICYVRGPTEYRVQRTDRSDPMGHIWTITRINKEDNA